MTKPAVLVLFIATLARAAAPPNPIDRIQAYAGTWKVQTEHLATPFSKAGHEATTLHNDCWKSAGFYACNQFVNGESKALIVFTFDAKNNRYTTYPIPAGGGDPGSGALVIDGNTWIYPWSIADASGKKTYFRVVNVFTSATHIEYRQEFSADQSHWTVMAHGTETKLP
jgi:hypothetical protein